MADHTHHHDDSHGTSSDDTAFTEANRAHWNKSAATYTSEQWQKELINKVTAFIQTHVTFIGVPFLDPSSTFEAPDPSQPPRSVRVLDYACGPGTVTSALGARATEYVGIDLSENMVQAYNLRFNYDSSPSSVTVTDGAADERPLKAHAVVGNLLEAEEPAHLSGPEYHNFDLVVVGMGFHHFADVRLAAKRLAARLRPGGIFLILDFVTHAMEQDAHPDLKQAVHTIKHHGFSEAELKDIFADAGLEDFAIVRMGDEVLLRGTSRREPFMARGRKP